MGNAPSKLNALCAAVAMGQRVWTGHLWDPSWFSQFQKVGCGELLSVEKPEIISEAIGVLFEAGADGVSTNTFGATPSVMIQNGVSPEVAKQLAFEANLQSARIAQRAAKHYSSSNQTRWVVRSMGPTLHCLTLMKPDEMLFRQIAGQYYEQAQALLEGGADVLHLERCMDLKTVRAALVGFERLQAELTFRLPVILTAAIEPTGLLIDASTVEQFARLAKLFNPIALGLTGRDLNKLEALLKESDVWGIALPDAFAVASEQGWFTTPSSLADQVEVYGRDNRVKILGVGLGAQPEYVRVIYERLRRLNKPRAS